MGIYWKEEGDLDSFFKYEQELKMNGDHSPMLSQADHGHLAPKWAGHRI